MKLPFLSLTKQRDAEKAADSVDAQFLATVDSSEVDCGSQVLPWLYLSGISYASSSPHSHHVNCAKGEADRSIVKRDDVKYLHVAVRYRAENPLEQLALFEEIAGFIFQCKERNKDCLVHCMRGNSRSVAAVLFYLVRHEKFTLCDAWKHVKSVRPFVSPSSHLKKQLMALEESINASSSLKTVAWNEEAGTTKKVKKPAQFKETDARKK